MRTADQALLTSQKGKGKRSSFASKQKSANTSQVKKDDKYEKEFKKNKNCFANTAKEMVIS
jgi:hypothetical protein